MTNHNVHSKKLIWKSISRRWWSKRIKHPLLSILFLPIHFFDPIYQRYIFIRYVTENPKKWIEEYLKEEEINLKEEEKKIDVHKSTNVELVNL